MNKNAFFFILILTVILISSCGDEPLKEITWYDDIDSALVLEKPVLVDFWRPG